MLQNAPQVSDIWRGMHYWSLQSKHHKFSSDYGWLELLAWLKWGSWSESYKIQFEIQALAYEIDGKYSIMSDYTAKKKGKLDSGTAQLSIKQSWRLLQHFEIQPAQCQLAAVVEKYECKVIANSGRIYFSNSYKKQNYNFDTTIWFRDY